MLHILHELMRGGDVRCLFSNEEFESILSQLSEVLTVKERSECQLSSRELWRLFVKVYKTKVFQATAIIITTCICSDHWM